MDKIDKVCEQLDEEHILFTKSEDGNISIRGNAEFVNKIDKKILDQLVYIKRFFWDTHSIGEYTLKLPFLPKYY